MLNDVMEYEMFKYNGCIKFRGVYDAILFGFEVIQIAR